MADTSTVSRGLEDTLAGTSGISTVDGIKGRLIYCGYDIRDLVASSTFEETTYLLWQGTMPTQRQMDELHQKLTAARRLPAGVLDLMRSLPKTAQPMAVLRTAVSALALFDENPDSRAPENLKRISTQLVAQAPTIVAAWERMRKGLQPVEPRDDLDFSANFLYMVTGKTPEPLAARVLDEALIMHADHEFNASTFTVRVIVSTLADMYSAVVGGIGALKGPSHGGANQDVMNMLDSIGGEDKVEKAILDRLAAKQRIPGFGHRVYKTYDPRALLLKKRAQELGELTGDMTWFNMSAKTEEVVIREKKIYPNVDFYSASTYHYLGIPTDLFTAVFVISRLAGWTAHAMEQYADNRLIRPRADYTGPVDVQYVPIDKR